MAWNRLCREARPVSGYGAWGSREILIELPIAAWHNLHPPESFGVSLASLRDFVCWLQTPAKRLNLNYVVAYARKG